jgi:hypothetical protein
MRNRLNKIVRHAILKQKFFRYEQNGRSQKFLLGSLPVKLIQSPEFFSAIGTQVLEADRHTTTKESPAERL